MRYAVVSDIHANLQSWNAVLTDIATQQVDRIVCLGDSIGYGPNPSEVLESAYRHVDAFCMGNHDAAVCGKLDTRLFNDNARKLIEWTQRHLSDKARRFLAAQPLTLTGPGFRCTHGDFTEPAAFHYIENAEDAAACWSAVPEPLLFTGHTHVAALFVIGDSGTTHHLAPQDFVIEPGKRYLVNPGSAGNPRAGAALASYCIYDDHEGSVVWRTVPFDLDAYRQALHIAGLAEDDAAFLTLDPRRNLTAVREAVCFSPARTREEQAHDVTPVSELARLSLTARRWKRIALATVVAGSLTVAATVGMVMMRPAGGPLILPPAELHPADPASSANLLPPFPSGTDGKALPGWRVRFDNPEQTSLETKTVVADELTVDVTITGARSRYRIESPPVRVNTSVIGQFLLKSSLLKSDDFNGTVLFAVEQLGEPVDGVYPVLVRETKDPPPKSPIIKFTTDRAKTSLLTHFVRLSIEGEHSGTATFTAPTMEAVERPR